MSVADQLGKMVRSSILILGCCVFLPMQNAVADVLTCTRFKIRLNETIALMGGKVTTLGALIPDYQVVGAGQRFSWVGRDGLSGTMNCGKSDAFEDFNIVINDAARTSEGLPDVLARFTELASTSVCALSLSSAEACHSLVRTMTARSLFQFKTAMAKTDVMPTGTQDYFIAKGMDAELVISPVGISWSIGPGLSMTINEAPQPLMPRDADDQ